MLKFRAILAALLLGSLSLPFFTFEASYTDSSGAHCFAFAVSPHEVDFCYGNQDRPPTSFDACQKAEASR